MTAETVVCICAGVPPTMPTYRTTHLPTCPVWVVENVANVIGRVTEPVTYRSAETATLGEGLPREMARVRDEILPQFLALRGMPNIIVEPQIAMMRAELDRAARALAEGDVVAMIRCYNSLKEYES